MKIDAVFHLVGYNPEEIQQVQQHLEAATLKAAGEHSQVITDYNIIDLSELSRIVTTSPSFLDDDMVEFCEELMADLDLNCARFVFTPQNGEWRYGILTDSCIEYVGTLNTGDHSFTDSILSYIPMSLQFLALLGADPDDALLKCFRQRRYQWAGLLNNVDHETFFTAANIQQLWNDQQAAARYFLSSQVQVL